MFVLDRCDCDAAGCDSDAAAVTKCDELIVVCIQTIYSAVSHVCRHLGQDTALIYTNILPIHTQIFQLLLMLGACRQCCLSARTIKYL